MKPYLLFAWPSGSPKGGWADFQKDFDAFHELIAHVKWMKSDDYVLNPVCDVFQCYERTTGEHYKIILDGAKALAIGNEFVDVNGQPTQPVLEDGEIDVGAFAK